MGHACAPALAWEPYLALDSFAHAEPAPIKDFVDGWNAPLDSGSDAITHNWFEAGVRHAGWSLAYVQRYDYEIKASRGAAELYHRVQNKLPFATGEQFDLELDAWHVRLQGLRVAYRWDFARWGNLETGLSALDAWKLIDGRLQGQATAVAAGDYDFSAQVDYVYSEDLLFDRQAARPGGWAWSFDLDWHLPLGAQWSIDARVRDLAGRVHWDAAPLTTAQATSDNKQFDDDGYVSYSPALSGVESNRDHVQRLHPRALLDVAWQALPAHRWSARLRLTEVRNYASLLWLHDLPRGFQIEAETLVDPFALGLRLGWRGFSIGWLADAPKADDAHVLQVQLRGGWTF